MLQHNSGLHHGHATSMGPTMSALVFVLALVTAPAFFVPIASQPLPLNDISSSPAGLPVGPPSLTYAAKTTAARDASYSLALQQSTGGIPDMPTRPAGALEAGSAGQSSQGCYVLVRQWPLRVCSFMPASCPANGTHISNAEACQICNRGFGVYASNADCINAGANDEVVSAAEAIDPNSYPAPSTPPPSCNPINLRARMKMQRTIGRLSHPCPHAWPDLKLWEDDSTWGGWPRTVPGDWADVVLPRNTRVLVTACSLAGSAGLRSITIPPSSELIIDNADVLVKVGVIYVQGWLRAGSADCRMDKTAQISFVRAPGLDVSVSGIQVASGGRLDLHGRLYTPTWTRLAATAAIGDNALTLQERVNWQPGQLVTITTSYWRDELNNQNEVATIASVSADGKTIGLRQPLAAPHYGGPEYQCEVGLLSRNIVLMGPVEAEKDKKGAHVKIEGKARLSGVVAYRMGQRNVEGAYPFHYHMVGWVASTDDSYVSDCVVYHSFFRAVVVHATSNLLVKDNVAFHVDGHAFYLEDGVEEHNTLDHNLAAFIHVIGIPSSGALQEGTLSIESPERINPTDAAASGFYIPNPNNIIKNNAASGGWSGFSFPVLPAPTGMSRARRDIVPQQRPLLLFDGNTAHSTGYFWQRAGGVYVGGKVWNEDSDGGKKYYSSGRYAHDTMDEAGQGTAFFKFTNTKVWLAQWGIMHWGNRVLSINHTVMDCTRGATLFGVALLQNALINGRSANAAAADYPGNIYDLLPIAGFQWYDTRVMTILNNVTFMNYDASWAIRPDMGSQRPSLWLSMVHSDEYKPGGISATDRIKYINVDKRLLINNDGKDTGASRYFNWVDYDGSSVMRPKPSMILSYPHWWRVGDDCTYEPDWSVWVCDKQPWRELARLDIRIPGYTRQVDQGNAFPPEPAYRAGYVAQFGFNGDAARSMIITRNEGITGMTGNTGWYVHWWNGAPPQTTIFPTQLPKGKSLVLAMRYPAGTQFSIEKRFQWYPALNAVPMIQAKSLQDVLDGAGDKWWFNGQHLYIKMTDPGDPSVDPQFSAGDAIVYGTRWFSMSYVIDTNLNCPSHPDGGNFCYIAATGTDIPPAITTSFASWAGPPQGTCVDIQPKGIGSCANHKFWGNCGQGWMTDDGNKAVQAGGGYCAKTCDRCKPGSSTAPPASIDVTCKDVTPPGGWTCAQQVGWGKCSEAWMKQGNFCRASCGVCKAPTFQAAAPTLATCGNDPPPGGPSCAEIKSQGKCFDPSLYSNGFCASTCNFCYAATEVATLVQAATAGKTEFAAFNAASAIPEGAMIPTGNSSATGTGPLAVQNLTSTTNQLSVSAQGTVETVTTAAPGASSAAGASTGTTNNTASGVPGFTTEAAIAAVVAPPPGVCSATAPELLPPGVFGCAESAALQLCGLSWFASGGYCARTCARC